MRREIVPAELIVPAQPVLDPEWVERRLRGQPVHLGAAQLIDMRGINTRPTSVAEAERVSRSVLRDFDQAIRSRDRTSIWKTLRDRPELVMVPNVRDTVSRWISNGSVRAPRGRPRGTTTWSPLVVAALVEHLISNGVARNREVAFSQLAQLGLTYDSAKRIYAQASREPRFRALLLLDEEKARPVGEGDLRLMASAEALTQGQTVVRSRHDPALGGRVDMRLRGRT